jgi:hypothetical protein
MTKDKTKKFFEGIDYQALQKQKLHLLNLINEGKDSPEMLGILELIDNLQDSAVDDGFVSEGEAFGSFEY